MQRWIKYITTEIDTIENKIKKQEDEIQEEENEWATHKRILNNCGTMITRNDKNKNNDGDDEEEDNPFVSQQRSKR